MKKTIFYINIILVVFTLLAITAKLVDPNEFWPIAFIGLIFPYLIILNVLFVIIWLFTQRRYAILSLLMLIICNGAIGDFFQIDLDKSKKTTGLIEIMTYNLGNGTQIYSRDASRRNKGKQELVDYFRTLDIMPDIMCFQEVQPFIKDILNISFKQHRVHQIENRGTAIYSVYPIVDSGEIDFGTRVNSCMWADLLVYNDTLRVYSVHLQSNQITSETAKIVNEGSIQDEKTWNSVGSILSKYKNNNQRRSLQVQRIKEHIAHSPYPVILGADLNDPPQSFTYYQLSQIMKDSFREKGRGLGTTFAGHIPLLRIDFLMTTPQFKIHKHQIDRVPFSDHYPIISSLTLD